MNSRYSISSRGRIRPRNHRRPDTDPNWVDPEITKRVEEEKLHQQFVEGLSDSDPVINDASKKNDPIKLIQIEHTKDSKLGIIDVLVYFSIRIRVIIISLDNLLIEDTIVMDRVHDLQQALEELTTVAQSRANHAKEVG